MFPHSSTGISFAGKLLTLLSITASALFADVIKIACVGDSITFGAAVAARERLAYPQQLGYLLGSDYEVGNFGRSGATMLRNGDLPYHRQPQYTASLAFQPDIVLIKLGTNDSKPKNWVKKDQFVADAKTLAQSYLELPSQPRVIFCKPVVVAEDKWGITEAVTRGEVAPAVEQAARELGLEVVDLHPVLSDHLDWVPDGVHPNAFGAEAMARYLHGYLTRQDSEFNPAAHPAPSAEFRGGPAGWGGGIWWDQHDKINQLAKENPDLELIFLGDSISQSWTGSRQRIANPEGKRTIDTMFGERWKTASFGISGDRTEHLLYRIKNGNFEGLSPKVVVLMIGVNNILATDNSAEQISEGIKEVARALIETLPETEVLLLGPFPTAWEPRDPKRLTCNEIQQRIAYLGNHPRVHHLDLSQAFTNADGTLRKDLYSGDGIHLKSAGYVHWAECILPSVEKLVQ